MVFPLDSHFVTPARYRDRTVFLVNDGSLRSSNLQKQTPICVAQDLRCGSRTQSVGVTGDLSLCQYRWTNPQALRPSGRLDQKHVTLTPSRRRQDRSVSPLER
jgi:hypothetical protein